MAIDPLDAISKINGLDPIEYFTNYANKYDYDSKSDHGRVNGELSGAFYNKRLDVYNLPDTDDESVQISFVSGKYSTIHFVVTTSTNFSSSADAQAAYDAEIKSTSPYTNSTNMTKKTVKQQRHEPIKLFEHRQPLEKSRKLLMAESEESDFELLFASQDYFNLYQYKKQDLVLAIVSFSPEDLG